MKECGANQSVNQEEFLHPVCRLFRQGTEAGIHLLTSTDLDELVENSWVKAHKFPGPVHINLPIEEPLHASSFEQNQAFDYWLKESKEFVGKTIDHSFDSVALESLNSLPKLDPSLPGVVVVGVPAKPIK